MLVCFFGFDDNVMLEFFIFKWDSFVDWVRVGFNLDEKNFKLDVF